MEMNHSYARLLVFSSMFSKRRIRSLFGRTHDSDSPQPVLAVPSAEETSQAEYDEQSRPSSKHFSIVLSRGEDSKVEQHDEGMTSCIPEAEERV